MRKTCLGAAAVIAVVLATALAGAQPAEARRWLRRQSSIADRAAPATGSAAAPYPDGLLWTWPAHGLERLPSRLLARSVGALPRYALSRPAPRRRLAIRFMSNRIGRQSAQRQPVVAYPAGVGNDDRGLHDPDRPGEDRNPQARHVACRPICGTGRRDVPGECDDVLICRSAGRNARN